MTKIKKKVAVVKEKAMNAKDSLQIQLNKSFNGILIIVAMSFVMGLVAWIVKDTDVNAASAGFWSLMTLVITSMFVIIHSRFKK